MFRRTHVLALALLTTAVPLTAAAQTPAAIPATRLATVAPPTSAAAGDLGPSVREGGLRAVPAAVSTAWDHGRVPSESSAGMDGGRALSGSPITADPGRVLPGPLGAAAALDAAGTLRLDPSSPETSLSLRDWREADAGRRGTMATTAGASRTGRHGAVAGAVVGIGAGAFLGAFLHAVCEGGQGCGSAEADMLGGAVIVGATGALVGWAIGEVWHAATH